MGADRTDEPACPGWPDVLRRSIQVLVLQRRGDIFPLPARAGLRAGLQPSANIVRHPTPVPLGSWSLFLEVLANNQCVRLVPNLT